MTDTATTQITTDQLSGHYTLDPTHSRLGFVTRHAMVTKVRGAFNEFEADLDVAGLDAPFHAVFIRAPFVEEVGAEVEVLAAVDGHPVVCRQGPVMVTAFHPELTPDLRLHQEFLALAG